MLLNLLPIYINGSRHLIQRDKQLSFNDTILLSGKDLLPEDSVKITKVTYREPNLSNQQNNIWKPLFEDGKLDMHAGLEISVRTVNKETE